MTRPIIVRILRPATPHGTWRIWLYAPRREHPLGGMHGGAGALCFYGPTLAAAIRQLRR